MPIRISNLPIKEEEKSVNHLIKYQVGKIRKLNSTGSDEKVVAEEVRKLHILVSKNSSSVRGLRFGSAQEDADEFFGALIDCLNDEKGPFLETSLIVPTNKEEKEKVKANSSKGENTSVIKVPLVGKELKISELFKTYQQEENVDKDNCYEFPIDGGGKQKLLTSKKLSVFVQDDKKEIYLQLKRFEAENYGRTRKKITSDIDVDNIKIPFVKDLKFEEKPHSEFDKKTQQNVESKYLECEEIKEFECKKITYEPTAFVVHHGPTLNRGHYDSYVKEREPDGSESWYWYNDDSRSKVKETEAKEAMKQAYIVKYSPRGDDNKVDLPMAHDYNTWSGNLGNTCWANSSIAIVARSKSSEQYEDIKLSDDDEKLYNEITGSVERSHVSGLGSSIETDKKRSVQFASENPVIEFNNQESIIPEELERQHSDVKIETISNEPLNHQNKKSAKDEAVRKGSNHNSLFLMKSLDLKIGQRAIDTQGKDDCVNLVTMGFNMSDAEEKIKNLQEKGVKAQLKFSSKESPNNYGVQVLIPNKQYEAEKKLLNINAVKEEVVFKEPTKQVRQKNLEDLKKEFKVNKLSLPSVKDSEVFSNVDKIEERLKTYKGEVSLETKKLIKNEIDQKDKVFANKLVRALNRLRENPKDLNDEEKNWKNLTTLDRRVLVDYYNQKHHQRIDFQSLYKEAKGDQKADLTINSQDYIFDSAKIDDLKKVMSYAAEAIPKSSIENPVVKRLAEKSRAR